MLTLGELISNSYMLKTYNKNVLQLKGVKLVWLTDYYSGPLTGVAKYKDKLYAFEMIDEFDSDTKKQTWHRRYALIELTINQIENLKIRHSIYQKYIGFDFDILLQKKRYRPKNWDSYNKVISSVKEPYLRNNNIIGWFED